MKPKLPWHFSPIGHVILFLGSVELAVPVLVFVAGAMAWGTYLESTQSAKAAKAAVYGSWWFIALMGLVCASLIFAVVTRYPWKKRHVGFMCVHASLIAMIAAGFWSLHSRVEGHLALEEGNTGQVIELDEDVVEVAEFAGAKITRSEHADAPKGPGTLALMGTTLQVIERWDNTSSERYVAEGTAAAGMQAVRAVDVQTASGSSAWAAEEGKGESPTRLDGLAVRVLADGIAWTPPASAAPVDSSIAFVIGETRYPMGEVGSEVFPGWTITAIKRFERATVTGSGLVEGTGDENPAVDIVITDSIGSRGVGGVGGVGTTTERHTFFQNFPDMVLAKVLEGTGSSGARLTGPRGTTNEEMLVVYGPCAAPELGYIGKDGVGRMLGRLPSTPAEIDLGSRRVTIRSHFSHAYAATRFVKAPPAAEHRPALVLRVGESAEALVVPWKEEAVLPVAGKSMMIRFGPRLVQIPFAVTLKDFRKTDYPGTEMAMAYESEVTIGAPSTPNAPGSTHVISMNFPYKAGPWKVYQSGFMGETVSVFSVMRDPGLPLTYAGSIGLCLGIFLTFYSRSLSWGHPGIPIDFRPSSHPESPGKSQPPIKERSDDVSSRAGSITVVGPRPARLDEPAHACR